MRTIQEVGTEILGGNPAPFYVFAGSEYGVKCRYIDMICKKYPNKIESQSVSEVLNFMSSKHLFPIQPSVYIIRYDDEFVASLNDKTKSVISRAKIIGCIVCIYENSKQVSKLDKYLGDYVVSIDSISRQFIDKYLHMDYPSVPDKLIGICAKYCNDYNHAKLLCDSMSHIVPEKLFSLADEKVAALLGVSQTSSENELKLAIAAKSFRHMLAVFDEYVGDKSTLIYTFLSVSLELEKIYGNKYSQSDIQKYVNRWTLQDIYNMFMISYNELNKLRTISSDVDSSLLYLATIASFRNIPSLEELSDVI